MRLGSAADLYVREVQLAAPEGWELGTLRDVVVCIHGGVSPTGVDRAVTNGERGVLKLGAVSGGSFLPAEHKSVGGVGAAELGPSLRKGWVLISRSNTADLVGAVAYVDRDYPDLHLPDLIWALEAKPGVAPHWLALALQTSGVRREILGRAAGTSGTMKKLSRERLWTLPVAVPPAPQQLRIAEVLAGFERAVRQLVALLGAKRRFKRGLMQQLLTGKRRFKEFEGTSWRRIRIGDLFEDVSRPVPWSDEATYQLLSIRRRSGGVFLREARKGSEIKTKQLFEVRGGDFLISKMQVVHGALGMVRQSFDGMHVSGSYVVLTNKSPDQVRTQFFDYVTRLPRSYRQALLASYGVHIEKMTFNLPWYLRSAISIPSSLDEQDRVVATLDSLEREVELLMLLKERLDRQRKALAELLLTGKVRIPA